MSALRFSLKAEPPERIDMSPLTPSKLSGLTIGEIAQLELGTGRTSIKVIDIFQLAGGLDDEIIIEGGSVRLDFVGAKLDAGKLTVDGSVGAYAGRQMTGGTLNITRNAGASLGSNLRGGLISVGRDVGEHLGGPRAGERDGMAGGIVVVGGSIGNFAGTRMRRGTVIARDTIGDSAGARMMGGTVWALKGFGASPGIQMRRGTLIAPAASHILSTFVDCGAHELVAMRILSGYLRATLGEGAPPVISGPVRKYAGDMASLGKGELLLTG